MLKVAAVLFALAALGGIILATLHRKRKDAPIPLALLHGFASGGGTCAVDHRRNADGIGWSGGGGAGDFCDRGTGWICAVRDAFDEQTAARRVHCCAWAGRSCGICGVAG
jgi:hypothetical protein